MGSASFPICSACIGVFRILSHFRFPAFTGSEGSYVSILQHSGHSILSMSCKCMITTGRSLNLKSDGKSRLYTIFKHLNLIKDKRNTRMHVCVSVVTTHALLFHTREHAKTSNLWLCIISLIYDLQRYSCFNIHWIVLASSLINGIVVALLNCC